MGRLYRGRWALVGLCVAPVVAGVLASTASATTPVVTVAGITVSEGATFSGTVATFPAAASHTGADYTSTIDWGDGTMSPGTTSGPSNGTITVSSPLGHVYAEGGHYTVTVTVTDTLDPSPPGQGIGSASVADALLSATGPSAVTLAEGGPVGVALAHFTDADPGAAPPPGAYTATVSWGDGTSSPGTVTGTGGGAGYDVSVANRGPAEEGQHAIVVAISDAGGAHTSVNVPANVLDAPLSGVPLSAGPVHGSGRAAFSAPVASFSDADPGATLRDYTAEITWGDGGASAGTIAVGAGYSFVVSGAHSFARSGTFTVTTIVQDAGGQTVTIKTSLTAVVANRTRWVVPRLHGLSIKAARVTLSKAHCALGTIRRHGRHASTITGQHPAPGHTGPAGTRVSVTIGSSTRHVPLRAGRNRDDRAAPARDSAQARRG